MRKLLLLLVLIVSVAGASSALAQNKKKEQKTRKSQSMTEKVYTRLTEAQELIETGKTNQGLGVLGQIELMKGLSSYEKAQLYNYYAYTYFTLERYNDAIRSYEKVLQQPDLPEALHTGTVYTLAQLYFTEENYRKAIQLINDWFKLVPKPTENAYLLQGQAYYQLEEFKNSLEPIKKAMAMTRARGEIPRENLYLLMRVNYYELGDYKRMADIIKEMLLHYNKREYWMTLAGAYSELQNLKGQMSIMEMLYERGDLPKGNQQLNLANLYLLHETPYRAAKLLDKGIKAKLIKPQIRNLRLLSQAWMQAKEYENALPPLRQAAEKSGDGELYFRLGQTLVNLDRYKEAVKALRSCLSKGGLKRTDSANIILGLAYSEQKLYSQARKAFQAAAKDGRSRKAANQWISFIDSEVARAKALEEGLKHKPRELEAPPEAADA